MKTIEAVARTYRGVLIFETMSGFVVFDENNRQYPCESEKEAQALIDAWIVASMTVSIPGSVPA